MKAQITVFVLSQEHPMPTYFDPEREVAAKLDPTEELKIMSRP